MPDTSDSSSNHADGGRRTLTVASVNVNGLRAATRNGMHDWLAECRPDVVTLQEVRAPDELVVGLLGEGWSVAHAESGAKGRAGVAVASRRPLTDFRAGEHEPRFAGTGRWIEADIELAAVDLTAGDRTGADAGERLTVISAYAHTGDAEVPARMAEKLAFFDAITERITTLRNDGRHVLLTGDLNVAHRDADLKNWKGNVGCAGCLPEERAHFDRWFDDLGWVDIGRTLAPAGPGPHTWWSYRGRAFDNDAGWRIDYQIASPELAAAAVQCRVDRAPSYDTRWSDHAPVVVTFQL